MLPIGPLSVPTVAPHGQCARRGTIPQLPPSLPPWRHLFREVSRGPLKLPMMVIIRCENNSYYCFLLLKNHKEIIAYFMPCKKRRLAVLPWFGRQVCQGFASSRSTAAFTLPKVATRARILASRSQKPISCSCCSCVA